MVNRSTLEDVDAAIEAAYQARATMADMPVHQRQQILRTAAALLKSRIDPMARAIVEETGKTLKDAKGELDRAWEATSFTADACTQATGEMIPASTVRHGEGMLAFVMRVPVGVVVAITPFNAPVSVGCHKIAPAIAGGNTVVLKPAPRGATSSLQLVELFYEAGLPEEALSLVHGGADVGSALVTDARVRLVNFTGGGRTASAISKEIGLKRSVMELGGNGAVIIHSDADIEAAIPTVAMAAFGLSGQSCVSLQRLLVHRQVYDQVVDKLVAVAENLKLGDPLDPNTDIGPLVTEEDAIRIENWTQMAVTGGARVLTGGKHQGAFFQPTVVVDTKDDMQLNCNEVFGPLVTISPYDDFDEAIDRVNKSPWGLQAGVFTRSLALAIKAARKIEVGGLMVNIPNRYRVENQPYGGVKQSGWGREGAKYAIEDMTDMRTVLINP
jgi:acyl-CoA reductase-like NAD-dependent aldehyde dehydrogenase